MVDGARRVFTYWEPPGAVTPYLAMCRETWDRSLGGAEVVTVDLASVERWAGPGALDLDTLARVPKAMQKDAVLVAVLHRQGGLFLDMDTLLTGDLGAMTAGLRRAGMVGFGDHLGAVAARPGTELLGRWLTRVQANLARVASGEVDPAVVRWDYLGNAPLDDTLDALRDRAFPRRLVRNVGRSGTARPTRSDAAARGEPWTAGGRAPGVRGIALAVGRRVDRAVSRPAMAHHRGRLDRRGFIAEIGATDSPVPDPIAQYRRFWFAETPPVAVADVLRPGVDAVALHNSWTPDWYQRLGRDQVLANPCLLSRCLAHLLP